MDLFRREDKIASAVACLSGVGDGTAIASVCEASDTVATGGTSKTSGVLTCGFSTGGGSVGGVYAKITEA